MLEYDNAKRISTKEILTQFFEIDVENMFLSLNELNT